MVCPSTQCQFPLLEMPVEIVRDVFEFAAWSDKQTAIALDRVNRTLHGWMSRPIYEEIVLHEPYSLVTFSEVIRQAPGIPHSSESPCPPEYFPGLHARALSIARDFAFFRDTVKYLSVMNVNIPFHNVQNIFITCTGIRVLEIDNPYLPFPSTTMQPSELILGGIKPDIFVRPMFRNVIRLWLSTTIPAITGILEYPPQLVSIAIPLRVASGGSHRRKNEFDETHLRTVMTLPSVKLIIINIVKGYIYLTTNPRYLAAPGAEEVWRDFLYHIQDSRLLVRVPKDLTKEPELARKQGISVWDRAMLDGTRHPMFTK